MPSPRSALQKLDTLQTIQVADGVEIQLPPAGPIPRALAYLLDGLILTASLALLGVALMLGGATVGEIGSEMGGGLFLLIYFVSEWGYHALCEASPWGGSIGKRAMGLRVVKCTGVALHLREALIRNIIRSADSAPGFFGIVGLVCILFTKRFQRLGDLAVDALVIYDLTSKKHQRLALAEPLTLPGQDIAAVAPPFALKRDEQKAITSFSNRLLSWSMPRQQEIADHLYVLTQHRGGEAVVQLRRMAKWLRES